MINGTTVCYCVLNQWQAQVSIVFVFAVAFTMTSKQYLSAARYHCGGCIMKASGYS
jgi:hypothetical protein